MFTILMDKDKYLTITTPNVNLFKGDNYVDSFQILVPYMYYDIDLRDFTAAFEYVDEQSNAFVDLLTADEDLYKDKFIRYTLPVTTSITKSSGTITAKLALNHVDQTQMVQYSLHTFEVKIKIHPQSDYYKFSDESLDKIDQLIGELETKIDTIYGESVDLPNDLGFDSNGTLHLTTNGRTIGTGVDVAVPGTEDDQDSSHDGVVDADEIYAQVNL